MTTPEEKLKAALRERFGEVISPEGINFIARAALASSRREVRSPGAGYDQLSQSHYCVDCNKRWFGDDVPCDRTCPFKTRIRALAEEE